MERGLYQTHLNATLVSHDHHLVFLTGVQLAPLGPAEGAAAHSHDPQMMPCSLSASYPVSARRPKRCLKNAGFSL